MSRKAREPSVPGRGVPNTTYIEQFWGINCWLITQFDVNYHCASKNYTWNAGILCVITVEFKIIPYRVLLVFELFTGIFFQDWAGWGIFTVIPGNPRRTKGDSQHLEARPELQHWPRSELFTVKNSRTGPFSNYLGNHFELCSMAY